MRQIEIKASNVEDAIEKGILELGVTRQEIEYEVLETGGFLKKAKVLISVKETSGEKAVTFLQGLFGHMKINVDIVLEEKEDRAEINVSGQDSGAVIGYRGDVLDAIQYITSLSVNKDDENYKKIVIDCENYRGKREITLASLANKLAEKATRTGRKVFLEPMNPFERRVIHSTLQDNAEVTTSSDGFDPNRFVIITPKNLKPDFRGERRFGNRTDDNRSNDRPRQGGFRDGNRDGNRTDNRSNDRPRQGGFRDGNRDGSSASTGNRDGFRGGNRDGFRDNKSPDRGERSSRPDTRNESRPQSDNRNSSSPRTTSSFSSFGTYLGNSKSGFTKDTDFTKKSGFDNLKD